MYNTPQVVIDLAEYNELKATIDNLTRRGEEGGALTEFEHQEATGLLLLRALENARLFTQMPGEVPLGKYKAIFVWKTPSMAAIDKVQVSVSFVRT